MKKFIDEKGRLYGRVSVIDLLIALAVVGLCAGYLYKRASPEINQIVNADSVFYMTLTANALRGFTVDAIGEGDVLFKQYDRQALGRVVKLETEAATDYLLRADGTAMVAEIEDRYKIFVTVACTGTITDAGYYLNGTAPVAPGSEMVLVSNRVIVPDAVVYRLSETP